VFWYCVLMSLDYNFEMRLSVEELNQIVDSSNRLRMFVSIDGVHGNHCKMFN